jgi:alpha-tubulin suppressor-like RCC1 family protein
VPSAALSGIVAISAGGTHSLALKANGTIVAWGDNGAAQGKVPRGLSNVVAVSAGDYHSLALRSDGTVIAWGGGNFGTTNVPPDLRDVIAIAAGYEHSLALQRDGRVVAWGWNAGGQTNVPGDLPQACALATGYGFSLSISTSGVPFGWGSKGLPLGGTNNWQGELVPSGLSSVRALAGGIDHIVALIDDAPTAVTMKQPAHLADSAQFEVVVPTLRGTQYFLESSESLGANAWQIRTSLAGDGLEHFLIDPRATESQRFYRVRCQ